MRSLRLVVPSTLVVLGLSFAPAQAAIGDDPGGEGFITTLLEALTGSSTSETELPGEAVESDPPETDPLTTDPPEADPLETDPPTTDPPERAPATTGPPASDEPPADPEEDVDAPEEQPKGEQPPTEEEASGGGPIGKDDTYELKKDSGPMLMSVTDNDVGSIMAVQAQSLPSNGELNMTGLRTFSYTPRPGFVGTDTFSYQAKDATQAASNPATVLLKVTPDGASQEESDDGDGREFRKGKNSDQRDRYDDDDDDDGCYRDGDRKHKKHGNKDWDDDDGGVLRNFDDSGQDGDGEGDWHGGGKGHWDDDDEDCDDREDYCERDDDDDDDDDNYWKHEKHWDWNPDWYDQDGDDNDGDDLSLRNSDGARQGDRDGDGSGSFRNGDWDDDDDGFGRHHGDDDDDDEDCDDDDDGDDGDDDGDDGDEGDEGELPDTGAPGNLPLLALGGFLVLAGLTVVRRARE